MEKWQIETIGESILQVKLLFYLPWCLTINIQDIIDIDIGVDLDDYCDF
jgi:hypothetical protein